MAVISISIIKSPIQKISGIPNTITLTTNIPATIFYTLDGNDPTLSSLVAVGPISMPTNNPSVQLKAFATDGINTSSVIVEKFETVNTGVRLPHAKITNIDPSGTTVKDLFPFGGIFQINPPHFDDTAGIVMSDENATVNDGYDGTATNTPAAKTNLPLINYDQVFSESDREGRRGKGIGTLPSHTTIKINPPPEIPISSKTNDAFFNPKALVIFQDSTKPQYDENQINVMRPYFSLSDQKLETKGDGIQLFNSGIDGGAPQGNFIKAHYNHNDHTMTYYYFDSGENRWIISKAPFTPKDNNTNGLSNFVLGREGCFVFEWQPFARRYLF